MFIGLRMDKDSAFCFLFRLKLTAGQATGSATATVEIMPVLPGIHMVEFARSSGSSVAFHELFKRLLFECQPIVASPGHAR